MREANSGDERPPSGDFAALARQLLDDAAEVRAVIDGLVRGDLAGTSSDQLVDAALDTVDRIAEALRNLVRGVPHVGLAAVTDAGAMRTVAAD